MDMAILITVILEILIIPLVQSEMTDLIGQLVTILLPVYQRMRVKWNSVIQLIYVRLVEK